MTRSFGIFPTNASRTFVLIWLLMMASIGAWFAYMAVIDNEPPFRYLSEEQGSHIVPNPVKPEGQVRTEWLLTDVRRDCPRKIERIYFNRDTEQLVTTQDPTQLSQVVKRSPTELSRTFYLPPGLPERTHYQAKACFECNVLQMLFPVCILSPKLNIDIIK